MSDSNFTRDYFSKHSTVCDQGRFEHVHFGGGQWRPGVYEETEKILSVINIICSFGHETNILPVNLRSRCTDQMYQNFNLWSGEQWENRPQIGGMPPPPL